jgi:hypothetical protein
MTKPKTWEDPAHSLDAGWPPYQSPIMELVAGARAVDWDSLLGVTRAAMTPTKTPASARNKRIALAALANLSCAGAILFA